MPTVLQVPVCLYWAASGQAGTALTLADHEPIVISVTNALEVRPSPMVSTGQ